MRDYNYPVKYATVAALALLTVFAPAKARADVVWMLEGVTLAGGASATGTFVTSDAGLLLSWDIVTSGYDGLIATPKTFDNLGGSVSSSVTASSFTVSADDSNVDIHPQTLLISTLGGVDLTAANSPVALDYGTSVITDTISGDFLVTGDLLDVPEPMSLTLLGVGLAGIVLRRRRRA